MVICTLWKNCENKRIKAQLQKSDRIGQGQLKMAIGKKSINKKYVWYKDNKTYALYYHSNNTVYYNRNFENKTKMIVFK